MAFTDPKLKAQQIVAQAPEPPNLLERLTDGVITADDVMVVILVLGVAWAVVSAVRAHRSKTVDFNLGNLILGDDGKINPEKFIMMTAFALWSWAIVKWTVSGVVSTADFLAYGGVWVTPLLVVLGRAKSPPSSTPPTS